MELTSVQQRTIDELLDVGDGRAFAPDLERGLREAIEQGIEGTLDRGAQSLVLWKERLNELDRCEGSFHADISGERPPFEHSPASAAGTLAHRAIEVDVAVGHEVAPDRVVELASERLRRDRRFAPYWDGLDQVERAELAMQALRSLEQFRASFPPVHAFRRALAPVSELWLESPFANGRVKVRGKVDLVLNPARTGRATRVLIDLKGGRARSEHPEDMRLYALLHTLRTGVPPVRVATFFLSSGEWMLEDVSDSTLEHAAGRVVAAAGSASRRARGDPPRLVPGPHCARCPVRDRCPAAV
jgi:hypothetical protein